jgi:hypothetical protein
MPSFDFKRLNRTIQIYRVVQALLLALLVFHLVNFQQLFGLLGKPQQLTSAIITALVCQLLLFYPAYRLAARDAGVEVEGSAIALTGETQAILRKKRMIGDLVKFCAIAFFIAFVALAPDAKKAAGAPLVQASTIFTFLLICLTYFQCFNFSAKKLMKEAN